WSEVEWEVVAITTAGDRDRRSPLEQLGGEGVFVKELESALLDGRIDMAVHSLKDMPTTLPDGLRIAAVPVRDDPREAVISRYASLDELPGGATVGTSSVRRRAQLLALRADLRVVQYRGNLDTRIRKVSSGEGPDAAVVAYAGLVRLGREGDAAWVFDDREFLPAAAQGAIAVEIRASDADVAKLVGAIDDGIARREVVVEREVLRHLGAGCRLPVGVRCLCADGRLSVLAAVFEPSGRDRIVVGIEGFSGTAEKLGETAARRLIEQGALELMRKG
ncbi:MAG TPA: hydroxymethylbilane synthase, partial [Proteobacteria bacterium]|nr:hydroxymethylbilane synthase [Pseudomonadota bacterium]